MAYTEPDSVNCSSSFVHSLTVWNSPKSHLPSTIKFHVISKPLPTYYVRLRTIHAYTQYEPTNNYEGFARIIRSISIDFLPRLGAVPRPKSRFCARPLLSFEMPFRIGRASPSWLRSSLWSGCC